MQLIDSDFIKFYTNRRIVNLYKTFLVILEDVSENNPNISQESRARLRKRVLDAGNDCYREIEDLLNKVDVKVKT